MLGAHRLSIKITQSQNGNYQDMDKTLLEDANRIIEYKDKCRKYFLGVANPGIEDA